MKTTAERQKEWRDRQRQGIKAPQCDCGRVLRGKKSKHRGVCSFCFAETETARVVTWEGVNNLREVEILKKEMKTGWIGEKITSPNGAGEVVKVESIGGETMLTIKFEDGVRDRLLLEDIEGNKVKVRFSSPTAS